MNNDELEKAQAETVELVQRYFPKGECAERSQANVLHGMMWVVFDKLLTTEREKARADEKERIENVFKKYVPPHPLSLEDSVWLKRILNKAFNNSQNSQ
jgi:hypothetical protein